MYSRQSLIDIFSTFIEFQADCFDCWLADAKLRRNFEKHRDQLTQKQSSEDFWSLYWHALWKQESDSSALGHLSAYLQETCYWSAQRVMRLLGHATYRLSDCFQLANVEIDRVLAGYDPQRGASLKGYAGLVYSSFIRDTLRQRQEADICTDWTLLRRVGKQRLVTALRQAGLSADAIAQYRLAWMCYQSLYVPAKVPTRKLRKPPQEQWSAIATLYNTERLTQLSQPGPALTPDSAEQWLTQCAEWIREYNYPAMLSLNTPSPNRDHGELQDELPSSLPASLLAGIIELEDSQQRQAQQDQLTNVLASIIAQLPPDGQTLLSLYYRSELTQKQIAQKLDLKQYAVSRRLTRTRETVLSALIAWAQTTLHTSPTPDLVTSMSAALEEWLTVHYRQQP